MCALHGAYFSGAPLFTLHSPSLTCSSVIPPLPPSPSLPPSLSHSLSHSLSLSLSPSVFLSFSDSTQMLTVQMSMATLLSTTPPSGTTSVYVRYVHQLPTMGSIVTCGLVESPAVQHVSVNASPHQLCTVCWISGLYIDNICACLIPV